MNGLVLSGGGARAAYQVGVLSYISEHAPEIAYPILTGVSAGAINAAYLAGHPGHLTDALKGLERAWTELTVDEVFRTDFGSLGLIAARWALTLGSGGRAMGPNIKGLVDTTPLRRFLTKHFDRDGLRSNLEARRLRALALTATRYSTGQTITFVDGTEAVNTWERVRRRAVRTRIDLDHVMASCSIPLIFPAIEIDGDYYGDGSIRQAAPLSPAIHLGADRLLAVATRYAATPREASARSVDGYPPPAQIIGMLFNTIFLDTLEADAERLQRINQLIEQFPETPAELNGMRVIDLLILRPSVDLARAADEYRKRLPRSVRFMLRGLGAERVRGADLVSYLLFEEPYVSRLIELGYEDARGQWSRIERFFAGAPARR